jgi:hypothetical protein
MAFAAAAEAKASFSEQMEKAVALLVGCGIPEGPVRDTHPIRKVTDAAGDFFTASILTTTNGAKPS